MSEHTPGPWKVLPAGNQWAITKANAKPRGDDDICMGSQYHDDWKANSRLLAAAPDLLDACKAMIDAYWRGSEDSSDAAAPSMVKAALAAIKKASS